MHWIQALYPEDESAGRTAVRPYIATTVAFHATPDDSRPATYDS
jgi:hypothetical protein